MTKNFFEFYDEFQNSEAGASKVMLADFCKGYSGFSELDCTLLTAKDFQNLLLMDEFLGQEEIYMPKLAKELLKKPRTKHIREIQASCKQTLNKLPKERPKRDWIHRYDPDPRTPQQIEEQHIAYALILLERDGIEKFAVRCASNLDLMSQNLKEKADEVGLRRE